MFKTLFRHSMVLLALTGLSAMVAANCDCGSSNADAPCTGSSVSYSREGHTIGFEFRCDGGDCFCGQFANGWDYWVAPQHEAGTVEITRMTPDAQTSADGSVRHGAEIDPEQRRGQGFTSLHPGGANRMEDFDPDLFVDAPFEISPYNLGRPSTILKAIDHEERCNNSDRQCLEYVETLTVVSKPPGHVFRPPYFGTEKPLYSAENLDLSSLSRLPVNENTSMSWDVALDVMRSVQLQHNRRTTRQGMTAAVNHQVDRGYHQFANTAFNRALLKLVEDPGRDERAKEQLARFVVQQGIDRYYIHKAPLTAGICGAWEGAGGFNGGNLMPIVLAGVLLGEEEWLDTVNENLSTRDGLQCFAETGFIQPNPEGRGKGIPTFGHLRTTVHNLWSCDGTNRNCASIGGDSNPSYELYDGLADGDPLGASGSPTAYQRCCTHGNWLGAALLVWLTPELKAQFPANAAHFLDYMKLRKQLGDEIGYEFGSYSNPDNYDVTGFNSNYGHRHFGALWDNFKDCFADESCPGMRMEGRPSPPVLSHMH